MKLNDFILSPEGKAVSQAEWARRVEVTRGYFSQLTQGHKEPSLRVAYRIERVTGGAVRMQDWVDDDGGDNDTGLRGTPSTALEETTTA